jgi:hypothetical protein
MTAYTVETGIATGSTLTHYTLPKIGVAALMFVLILSFTWFAEAVEGGEEGGESGGEPSGESGGEPSGEPGGFKKLALFSLRGTAYLLAIAWILSPH